MSAKFERYRIKTKNAPLRHSTPRIFVERKDTCINCGICVEACVYGVHERTPKAIDFTKVAEPLHESCVSCHRCVNECPMEALELHPHPEFQALGDKIFTPDLIETLLYEAETGRVPVSGQGYRGPFAGPGFDSIWTDMSEIVRPTRDGIHGREYIATDVDLGRKPLQIEFDAAGRPKTELPPSIRLPFPLFINLLPFNPDEQLLQILIAAARDAGSLVLLKQSVWNAVSGNPNAKPGHIGVRLEGPVPTDAAFYEKLSLVEIEYGPDAWERVRRIRQWAPILPISIRLPLDTAAPERAETLAKAGAEILHVYADWSGLSRGRPPRFLPEALRLLDDRLVDAGVRDAVSILASGGIGRAEYVPKSILCGADAVGIDVAALIALGLRHFDSEKGAWREDEVRSLDVTLGTQRLLNLLNSWRDQLLEVMGAMGLREARRLQGETGRAMFYDELENEFQKLFSADVAPAKAGVQHPKEFISLDSRLRVLGNKSPRTAVLADVCECGNDEPRNSNFEPVDSFTPPSVSDITSEIWRKIPKFKVAYTKDCIDCGLCISSCPYGVHWKKPGSLKMETPDSFDCIGPTCEEEFPAQPKGSAGIGYCVDACPYDAIQIKENPEWPTLGDPRWTGDLLFATWYQAEKGKVPKHGPWEYRKGASGGGFDLINFKFQRDETKWKEIRRRPDTSIDLNRRAFGPRVRIPVPWYGGGMSYGSVSLHIMLSRARAAQAWGTFMSTGEGGYPPELELYKDNIITQVATGLFGVREDTMAAGRFVEIKYAQGAKPGLGGHLLSDKNTPTVAALRETATGISLFSPFPFHSVYSVEDHKKHVDWMHATVDAIRGTADRIKAAADCEVLVSAKVSTPVDVDMVAVGCYYGGVNIIHLDGSYGGTGAAPDIAKKNIAMPIEYAIPKVHQFLVSEGIRDEVVLIASGGIRSAHDIAKAIALGADGAVLGTSDLVAVQCTRCGNCESGRGCQHGIASTDPVLSQLIQPDWGAQRIINLYAAYQEELSLILWRLGLDSVRALRGRHDLLEYAPPEAFKTS